MSTELFGHKVENLVSMLVLSKCRSWNAVTTLSLGLLTGTLLLRIFEHVQSSTHLPQLSICLFTVAQYQIWYEVTAHTKPWLGKISWTMPRPCRSCRPYYAPTLLLLHWSCSYHAHQVPSTLSLIRERSKDIIESWHCVAGVLYSTLMSNILY